MRKYKCSICGYIHDESKSGKWESLPDDFVCPMCRAPKNLFNLIEEAAPAASGSQKTESAGDHIEDLKELTAEEMSAIFSSLAKGCEKQRLNAEMEAFSKISDFYKARTAAQKDKTLKDAALILEDDINVRFPSANNAAKSNADRGALRSLVWSEKVSMMMKSLLERFAKEGEAILVNTKIFVCDICGFIFIGDAPPEICPVCKVHSYKIIPVERR